jgi:hypothetical protein
MIFQNLLINLISIFSQRTLHITIRTIFRNQIIKKLRLRFYFEINDRNYDSLQRFTYYFNYYSCGIVSLEICILR